MALILNNCIIHICTVHKEYHNRGESTAENQLYLNCKSYWMPHNILHKLIGKRPKIFSLITYHSMRNIM